MREGLILGAVLQCLELEVGSRTPGFISSETLRPDSLAQCCHLWGLLCFSQEGPGGRVCFVQVCLELWSGSSLSTVLVLAIALPVQSGRIFLLGENVAKGLTRNWG